MNVLEPPHISTFNWESFEINRGVIAGWGNTKADIFVLDVKTPFYRNSTTVQLVDAKGQNIASIVSHNRKSLDADIIGLLQTRTRYQKKHSYRFLTLPEIYNLS